MVVSVRHSDDILFRDERYAKRMLELCYFALAVDVTISVQILWVFITSDQESRGLQRFHIDGSYGAALRICHIELDFVVGNYAEAQT